MTMSDRPPTRHIDYREAQDKFRYLTRGGPLPIPLPTILVERWPSDFRERRHVVVRWLCEAGYVGLANELVCTDESGLSKWWKRRLGPFSIATNEYAALAKHQLSRLDLRTVHAAISEQWADADGYKLRLTDGELIFRMDGDWMRMVDLREDTYRAPIKYPDNRGRHSRTVAVDFHVGYDDHNNTAYVRRIRRSDVVAFDTVDGMQVRVPDDEIEPEFYLAIPPALRVEWADKVSQTGVQTEQATASKP